MNVLMFMHDDDTYGAPKSMIKLAQLLQEQHGIHPIMITPKKNKVNAACDELGIENYAVRNWRYYVNRNRYFFEPFVNFAIHKFYDMTFYREIAKVVDMKQIDLIHSAVSVVSHGHELSKRYGIPHVWHLRELEPYQYYFTKEQIQDMSENTSRFIAISNIVKQYWVNVGLPEAKIETIYNGIDPAGIVPRRKNVEGKIKIILAGRISPDKQLEHAVIALKELSDEERHKVQIDVYGDAAKMHASYFSNLKQSVIDNGLEDCLSFKGFTTKLPELMQNYDIALMTSKAEAFGRTTVEYMMAGLTVLATNTGANPELINNGVNGFIYDNTHPEELGRLIVDLLNRPDEIEKVGEQARKHALKTFTADANAAAVADLYDEVLKTNEKNT